MVLEKFNHTVAEKKWHSFWEENKIFKVPNIVSSFFAKDKNKTDITPRQIPKISGYEKATSKIITSSKAINTTSVLENPIPVAKLL